jgi:hypothetical protein
VSGTEAGPLVRVVRGAPTGTELAAVVAVLLAVARARVEEAPATPPPSSPWRVPEGGERSAAGWSAAGP